MIPTKRRIYPFDAEKQKLAEPILVAIDISEVGFSAR